MRWVFADDRNPEEAARKREALRRIDAWWLASQRHADDLVATIRGQKRVDVPQFMDQHLHAVDPGLCWEFGPALRGDGHRLVITPEGNHGLRPMVTTLLERAPTIDGWEFHPYRPPEPAVEAQAMAKARCGADAPDAEIRLARGRHNRIDVTFRAASFRDTGADRAGSIAFVLAETLFGEEGLDHWVGVIENEAPPPRGALAKLLGRPATDAGRFLPLDRAKPTLDALVAATLDERPDRPLHQIDLTSDHPWTTYAAEPPEQDVYPARDDVFYGSSAFMDITAATGDTLFHSGRFSRCGERFCYLKLDRTGVPREQWVAFRSRFEDALDPALRDAGAGAVFANATGAHFSYIDLALSDVPAAAEVVRRVLRPLGAPRESWLLFLDAEYADEWVGVWDDSPPPPRQAAPADEP